MDDPKEFIKRNSTKSVGCWEWNQARPTGYAVQVRWKGWYYTPARLSYETHFGEVPKGLKVLRACGNLKCVNPMHLYAGLPPGKVKLTKSQVREILAVTLRGPKRGEYAEFARRFNVTSCQISRVAAGKTFKDLHASFNPEHLELCREGGQNHNHAPLQGEHHAKE